VALEVGHKRREAAEHQLRVDGHRHVGGAVVGSVPAVPGAESSREHKRGSFVASGDDGC
jgi:hypothetical protein